MGKTAGTERFKKFLVSGETLPKICIENSLKAHASFFFCIKKYLDLNISHVILKIYIAYGILN